MDEDKPLTLAEYAKAEGRHIQTVRKDASRGRLPTWDDPITCKKVTSIGAVRRVREAAQAAAEAEFLQKIRLGARSTNARNRAG